jgi:hypothetical protein
VTLNGIATANITGIVTGTAGFTGNITGLKTVNVVASMGPIQLGGNAIGAFASEGLNTALTNITLDANQDFTAVIAAAALAHSDDAVQVTINGDFGAKGAPNVVAIGPDDGAAHGYESETFVLNGETDYLVLSQGPTGNSLKSLTLAGTATATVFANFPNNFNHLAAIDASDDNHGITITGALSGGVTTAAIAGLLATDTALTSLKFGAGNDSVDLTSFSAANLAGLTADGGAGTNTMIVTDAVATTTSEATFANIKDFQILSIGGLAADNGAGGTIDMALLPSSINEIIYQTAASSALIINNQTGPLTIDTEGNGHGFAITVNASPVTSAVSDSLHLIVGDTAHSTAGAVGAVTLFGEESVTITSQGVDGNTVGPITLTPVPGASEHVTIDGTHSIDFGTSSISTGLGGGAIVDIDADGQLNTNNLTLVIADKAQTGLNGGGSGMLSFVPLGDSMALSFSTNAAMIDASNSGGLIMQAGDANDTTSSTVAGSNGDIIIGSTTAGNVLGGSIGNDSFTVNNNSPNTIYTDGGADTIHLSFGHTAVNRIEFYAGSPAPGILPGNIEIPTDQSITENNDMAQVGWWGIPTGGTEAGYSGDFYAGLPAETGTSADATMIFNFNPTTDILDFAANENSGVHTHNAIWGAGFLNGLGGIARGLVNGDFEGFVVPTLGTNSHGLTFPPNSTGNVTTTNLFYLGLITVNGFLPSLFTGPTDVAQQLHDPLKYSIDFGVGGLTPGDSAHMLIVYQDVGGNTRIADLALANSSAAFQNSTTNLVEHVSDLAILVGVSNAEFRQGFNENVHFV